MSKAFIPIFGRRLKPPAQEAVVAAPEIKPLEWTSRKKKQCDLVLRKDANGKPLCENWFYPKGNERGCSPKCRKRLEKLARGRAVKTYTKKNRAKLTANQRESRAANREEVNAEQRAYRKRSGYNEKQQKYRAGKRKKLTCTDCGAQFYPRMGPTNILSNLCSDCKTKPCHIEAYKKDAKKRHAAASRKNRQKQKTAKD